MGVKYTFTSLWSTTVGAVIIFTFMCGAMATPNNLTANSYSGSDIAIEDGIGLDENAKPEIPTGGFDKLLSTWVAYTNGSTISGRPEFIADVNSGTGPEGESDNLIKRKPLKNIYGETLREVSECVRGDKYARRVQNHSSRGMDVLTRCLKLCVLKNVEEVRRHGAKSFSVFGGWLKFERMDDSRAGSHDEGTGRDQGDDEDLAESSGDLDLDLDYVLLSALDKLTRRYALKVAVYPDVGVRMARSSTVDAVEYSIESLYDDLEGDGRLAGGIQTNKKKKKKKKSAKKELAELKKRMLLMMVPMLVQAVVLPFALLNMKMMVVKALLAGKLAIVLILLNAARSAAVRRPDDKFQEQVAAEHYGYGGAPEPSAWFARRHYRLPPSLTTT